MKLWWPRWFSGLHCGCCIVDVQVGTMWKTNSGQPHHEKQNYFFRIKKRVYFSNRDIGLFYWLLFCWYWFYFTIFKKKNKHETFLLRIYKRTHITSLSKPYNLHAILISSFTHKSRNWYRHKRVITLRAVSFPQNPIQYLFVQRFCPFSVFYKCSTFNFYVTTFKTSTLHDGFKAMYIFSVAFVDMIFKGNILCRDFYYLYLKVMGSLKSMCAFCH